MTFPPIPELSEPEWPAVGRVPIDECDEPLVPLGLAPERIQVLPAYYVDGIPGAVPVCYARASVRERLLTVADRLPAGLRLVVLDAWRPFGVQQYLYDHLQTVLREMRPDLDDNEIARRTREFVAPPSRDRSAPSPHLTGGSVDVTVCDADGRMLAMGSDFDEITPRSHTRHYEGSGDASTVREYRRMLYHAMTAAGFTNLPSEWWHYDFGNQQWAWYHGEPRARYGLAQPEGIAESWRRQLSAGDAGR
ncbi:M15 family metallopeptidase [Arhodomonas sp. AD133]|uniref:M15 family metallopeptidase n=1 Tax=Arhodomonas sp. AD133 TaxID=3415009 RepID=UPI003EB9A1F8